MSLKKRIISLILSVMMLLSGIPVTAMEIGSVQDETPTICVSSTDGRTGGIASVDISLKNNPGVAIMIFDVEYDSTALSVENVVFNKDFGGETGVSSITQNPLTISYDNTENQSEDIVFATINFRVKANAKVGSSAKITINYEDNNIIDTDENSIDFEIEDGIVSILNGVPGDINSDESVNGIDLLRMRKYFVKYDVEYDPIAMDVTGDKATNALDLLRFRKYFVNKDTEIFYGTKSSKMVTHKLAKVEATEPTCTEDGNIAYWTCDDCGKFFEDEEAANEIVFEDTVVEEKGHTYSSQWSYDEDNHWHAATCEHTTEVSGLDGHTKETIPGYAPTYDSKGLTDGVKCSVCNNILVEQEEIAPLIPGEFYITYELVYNADSYLINNKDKIVNDNPVTIKENEEIVLKDATMLGYNFEGWYDGTGTSANRITKLEVGTSSDVTLYARWTLSANSTYTVYFVSDGASCDVNYNGEVISKITKPMNERLEVPAPAMKGYIFLGWTDGEGNIVNSIEPGSCGEITLSAHWTSERNQTRPVKELSNPIVIEDVAENKIHFIYELGDIINVPLETIENYGNVDRLERESKTVTTEKITATTAKTIAEAVTNVTSNSSSTTLSNEWNENVSVSEEQASGVTSEMIEEISDRVENGGSWNISKSNGGATEFTIASGSSSSSTHKDTTGLILADKMTTEDNSETGFSGEVKVGSSHKASVEKRQDFNVGLNFNFGQSMSLGVEDSGVSAGVGAEKGQGLNLGYSNGRTTYDETSSYADVTLDSYSKDSHKEISEKSSQLSLGTENSSTSTAYTDLTTSSSNTWNSEEAYTNSRSDAHTDTYTSAISQAIEQTLGYTTNSGTSGGQSDTVSSVEENENKKEYVSTVEISTEDTTETMVSAKVYKDYAGYHRLVEAGTIHVFGIVSYDIADGSFYTSTYSVLDTENRSLFYDYSKDGTYKDRENGTLPFEIPYFVNRYVGAQLAYTNGLKISPETGSVDKYAGRVKDVMLPNYFSYAEGDDERSAVRITSFKAEAFQNNTEIETVMLSDFITEIPDGAFEGCTNLKTVIAPGVTSIGNNAFDGCTSLDKFTISSTVEYIGENAFAGVPEIVVYACNSDVAKAAIESGAEKISLYLKDMSDELKDYSIQPGENTIYFALYGAGKEFNNVKFVSNAEETILNRATFNVDSGIALDINSSKLTLNQVNVTSPAVALLLRNSETDISFERTSSFASTDSGNAVVTNDLSIVITTDYAAYFNVNGKMLVNGNIDFEGRDVVSPEDCIEGITVDEYNSVIGNVTVTFNSNEGSEVNDQTIDYGTKAEKPEEPTREHYAFLGWFTDEECTEEFDFDTSVTSDITLYAGWELCEFTVTFNANGGTASTASKEVIYGESYGELPEATMDYHNFLGWYTELDGGYEVTCEDVFESAEDITLYAHWELKPVSGPVLATQVPADALVVDGSRYYTYTQKYEASQENNSSMPGWTLDSGKTTWRWSETPFYSSGWEDTEYWSGENGDEKIVAYKQEGVPTGTYNQMPKTQYRYQRARNSAGTRVSCCTEHAPSLTILEYTAWLDSPLSATTESHSCDCNGVRHACSNQTYDRTYPSENGIVYKLYWYGPATRTIYVDNLDSPITKSQWRYDKYARIYTYYFYRTENLQSSIYPTGDNISNIQEWVQYREK